MSYYPPWLWEEADKNMLYKNAMKLNRHQRRVLSSINIIEKIPSYKNVKIPWYVYLKFWTWFD
jgi:hypothetical protein